ncbi:unknown protein [Microcystis aeruginosa NIES-843]|uniref:Uncharacterized protein n=1 Tax=Microcystis aeruginosa (strain NIES-843 / IAM M-2473) TaxID=449447 RepID=B0JU20_MICAN|nr:unknown protein [Microcystis aeruginosa NIES-843]
MSFYIRVSSLITPVHCITQTEEPSIFPNIHRNLRQNLLNCPGFPPWIAQRTFNF